MKIITTIFWSFLLAEAVDMTNAGYKISTWLPFIFLVGLFFLTFLFWLETPAAPG